jgi:hypothetical protein
VFVNKINVLIREKHITALQLPVQINCKAQNNEPILPQPKDVFGSAAEPVRSVATACNFLFFCTIMPFYV